MNSSSVVKVTLKRCSQTSVWHQSEGKHVLKYENKQICLLIFWREEETDGSSTSLPPDDEAAYQENA